MSPGETVEQEAVAADGEPARIENYCAACRGSIYVGAVNWDGAQWQVAYFSGRKSNKRPLTKCPHCHAPISAETVLSAAALEWREHAELMEQLTGKPYKVAIDLPRETATFTPKARGEVPMPEREEAKEATPGQVKWAARGAEWQRLPAAEPKPKPKAIPPVKQTPLNQTAPSQVIPGPAPAAADQKPRRAASIENLFLEYQASGSLSKVAQQHGLELRELYTRMQAYCRRRSEFRETATQTS